MSKSAALLALAVVIGVASVADAKPRRHTNFYQDQPDYNDPVDYPAPADEMNAYGGAPEAMYRRRAEEDMQPGREYAGSTRETVPDPTHERAGTITVDTRQRVLYLSLGNGEAIRYGVGVGREGFTWKGRTHIGRMEEWPEWRPPKDMLKRRPDLPPYMEGGIDNPLGARAMYLFAGNKDTMFRIHGSNEPWTIGHAVSSGCIRMLNEDVTDLFNRVNIGTTVVVL